MEKSKSWPHIFGVRHLSPAGAWHLAKFLDEVKPEIVLIEGPSDANSQIEYIVSKDTIPPIAILAYTEDLPVRTILYPFASYSPEYAALKWARENGSEARFIDLPSSSFLALEYKKREPKEEVSEEFLYSIVTRIAGEEDYETYWEKNFEHNLSEGSYRGAIFEFSKQMRELSEGKEAKTDKTEFAENLIREAYMRRQIAEVLKEGYSAEKIVVITGAYHSSAIIEELEPMTEEEFKRLPQRKSKLTLMPYSYFKLSSQSGYGAGNKAPAYFDMMWNCMLKKDMNRLPEEYLTKLVGNLREKGTYRSTADIIEGVRLAVTLAAMKGGSQPSLKDLKDAAITCIGYGEFSTIAEACAKVEVGTAIGNLPDGVSKTPIQDDFYRELKRLKLEKYRATVAQGLELDLRENRRVKSEEAAFLDLNRSFFLHRLRVLSIGFARQGRAENTSANWAENWVLQWTPEAEIEMVESTLKGETLELAAAFEFKERMSSSTNIDEIAKIIREACECGMMSSMEDAKRTLQAMAIDCGDFVQIAKAAHEIAIVISYGDIRRFSKEPLIPLLEQLFLRGTLMLLEASSCNSEGAAKVIEAMYYMNAIADEHYSSVDSELWYKRLEELSDRDDKNSKISGYACGILVEKGIIYNEKLSSEVSRRLSPGIEADLGAGWFEGLSSRNRYALLSRMSLWAQLEQYISDLDSEQFLRALVFLRRAFGSFSASEKCRISEILGEIWGVNIDDASESLNNPLSTEETQVLEDLNDFDFGDL